MQESYKVANATQETKFRIGQTVWCLLYGKGKVVNISPEEAEDAYPVLVEFEAPEHDCVNYTSDGKYYSDANRTLFFSEPKIEAATEPVFEPKLVGKVVMVKNLEGDEVDYGFTEIETEEYVQIDGSVYNKSKYCFYEFRDQPITFD